jgi:hypothetical protein
MKAVTVKEINQELLNLSPKELRDLCIRLSRFKKENKELLTYLLFEAADEESYIESVKKEIDDQFSLVNKKTGYLIKKGFRKILRNIRKYSRYSLNKKTEVDLLIYFCVKIKRFSPSVFRNTGIVNLYNGQLEAIRKKVSALHEELQLDYEAEMEVLQG